MRWKSVLAGLALAFGVATGCKQQCFMTQCDYEHCRELGLPNLESNPMIGVVPSSTDIAAPPTVLYPEREMRFLSLAEAIAIAIERGTTGDPRITGLSDDTLVSFSGTSIAGPNQSIRVLALDPAIVGTDIEASLSKFDAQWNSSLTWNTTDQPVGSNQQTILAGNNIFANQTQSANLTTGLFKPLPTGGVAGITFLTDYTLTNLPSRVNPLYQPQVQFQFEQPLLQGFGVEINELRSTHPNSVLTPLTASGARVEGILITRIRFDQQRAEFERNLHVQLGNVEVAYWNLYGAYGVLYAEEQGLRQAYEGYVITKERYRQGNLGIQNFAQSRAQYELFRTRRVVALEQVLTAEHDLRGLLGLPVEDETRLVPADEPSLAPLNPDWHEAINDALAMRPELVLSRQEVKFRQLDLINRKNLTLPDLRFLSQYGIVGQGTHLDGGANDPNNALHSLATDKFIDYTFGFRLNVPLGFRDANASVRQAKLRLAQSYATLQDQELKTQRLVKTNYQLIFSTYEQIRSNRATREARTVEVQARLKDFIEGRGNLEFLLTAERLWANAIRDEYISIRDYNTALARFEYAKGTIMERDNIVISEGPLPNCVQVRAVEHERERTKALVLRERPMPIQKGSCKVDGISITPLPVFPADRAPALPALLQEQPPLPNSPDDLLPAPLPDQKGIAPAGKDSSLIEAPAQSSGNDNDKPSEKKNSPSRPGQLPDSVPTIPEENQAIVPTESKAETTEVKVPETSPTSLAPNVPPVETKTSEPKMPDAMPNGAPPVMPIIYNLPPPLAGAPGDKTNPVTSEPPTAGDSPLTIETGQELPPLSVYTAGPKMGSWEKSVKNPQHSAKTADLDPARFNPPPVAPDPTNPADSMERLKMGKWSTAPIPLPADVNPARFSKPGATDRHPACKPKVETAKPDAPERPSADAGG